MEDAIGLAFLAVVTVIIRILVGDENIPNGIWIVGYIFLGALSLLFWHSKYWSNQLSECGLFILITVIFGGVLFGLDYFVGQIFHPELPGLVAATRVFGPLGMLFTVIVCPGLTTLAVAGTVRALYLSRKDLITRVLGEGNKKPPREPDL